MTNVKTGFSKKWPLNVQIYVQSKKCKIILYLCSTPSHRITFRDPKWTNQTFVFQLYCIYTSKNVKTILSTGLMWKQAAGLPQFMIFFFPPQSEKTDAKQKLQHKTKPKTETFPFEFRFVCLHVDSSCFWGSAVTLACCNTEHGDGVRLVTFTKSKHTGPVRIGRMKHWEGVVPNGYKDSNNKGANH